jgi:acetyltransferase-like isoleucine patch superfamily enzyme
MDTNRIQLLRQAYREYLDSGGAFFELPVGDDVRSRNRIPFQVLFPGLRRPVYYLRHFIARIAQYIDYSPIKILIYRSIGFRIGKGVYIAPDVILDPQFPAFLEIGDNVVLGWGSKVFVHDYDGIVFRIGRVRIGRGSVIGGFSFIRAGVTIPENSLVKFGSRIFRDQNHDIMPLAEVKRQYESRKDDHHAV